MSSYTDVQIELDGAIRESSLERVREMILSVDSQAWSEQYAFVCDALSRRPFLREVTADKLNRISPGTPLHLAVSYGAAEIVDTILRGGADVEAKDEFGDVPLHLAVVKGYAEIVKLLLASQTNIDVRNGHGKTPLYLATEQGYSEIVQLLLDRDADVNFVCSLDAAVIQRRCTEIMKILQLSAAKIIYCKVFSWFLDETTEYISGPITEYSYNATDLSQEVCEDGYGGSSLHLAAANGYLEVVKFLLKNGSNVHDRDWLGRTPLYMAAKQGHSDTVQLLLESGADVNSECLGDSAGAEELRNIMMTVDYKNTFSPWHDDVLKCRDGFYHGHSGSSLHLAAVMGHLQIVKLLLRNGSNANGRDCFNRTPLHLAARQGHLEIVKLLLDTGADVNFEYSCKIEYAPLSSIIEEEDAKIVKVLVENGANPYCERYSPLYNAIGRGNFEIAAYLISKGALVNSGSRPDLTPLDLAIENGREEFVKLLLNNGAHIGGGLHRAAIKGYEEIVQLLLEFNANVNAPDAYGRTALFHACLGGQYDVAKILIEHEADVNLEEDGVTVLDTLHEAENSDWAETDLYDFIAEHVVKLKAANFYVNLKCNRNTFRSRFDFDCFYGRCKEELQKMKTEKIGKVRWYDILTKHANDLAAYARNPAILQALDSPDCASRFPIYADVLRRRMKRGVQRRNILDLVDQESFLLLLRCELPSLVIGNILSYLRDQDVRNLAVVTGQIL